MELSVKDRLFMPTLFPSEGSFAQFNLKKSINAQISITDKEKEELGLRHDEEKNMIVWDTASEIPLCVDFSSGEKAYLKECCEKISEQPLQDEMWALVTKIYDSI